MIRTRTRTAAEACSTLLHRFAASRTFAVVVILAFLVLLLLIFLALRWTHYNPVALDWSKGRDELLVKNQYGFTVLALPIRHQHPNEVSLFGYSRALADLDGDGVKEVIAIHDGREEAFSALSMFDRKKQPAWTRFCNDLSPGIERKVDGLAWFAFLPLELGPGEPARLACLRRSRQGSLSVLEIDDAATGQLLGRMSNIGHIEAIYETDLDRDGRKDLWACGTDNVTGMALLAVLDPAAFRIEEGATRVSDLLGLTDPRSLGAGVLSLVELPKLSYSRSERAQCTTVQIGDDGGVIAGSADPDGNCLFHLRFPDLRAPVLDHVQITDAGRSIIRFRAGRDVPLAEFAAEEAAMAQAARILTPDGWRPCPGGEASQPAPRESEISEIPAGGR
ncbi:MAG: hypothetical protein QUU85_15335 [Candidatus Eisenbacteria bacterium]|nr:hypothetical protein [Candidatus Eisenbacteria bacterium]